MLESMLEYVTLQEICRPVGMADEVDSKSIGSNVVRVQVPRPALLGRGKIAELSD